MAERRMFAKTIVLSDAFLDMPMGARCLYMTFGMIADDDGFVNSPKSVMRQCGASEDDMKVLIAKKFIIPFETGVIVIKHWRINNYLRSDRYKETIFTEEREKLTLDDKGNYHVKDDGIPNIGIPDTVSTGKDSIGKNSIDNTNVHPPDGTALFDYLWDLYPNKKGKKRAFEAFKRAIKKGTTVEQIREGIKAYKRYIKESGIEAKYIKMGSTFFVQEAWNDDWTPTKEKPKNAFNDFKQNEYEWDELEKELLDNG